ncbi:unnamed protein product, partial [Mesorhabditis belari]|uniref:MoaB/Mog domain-containing protein n=1 Tax=Mesorhabditis belari TaxID=2138241 RepID=A0AAF3EIK4_9BILA
MSVIHRHRVSPWTAIPMDEAYSIIEEETDALDSEKTPVWRVKIGDVLAEDVNSAYNVPEVRTSIKDGYAVLASDSPGKRKVIGFSTAGSPCNSTLNPGECVRVSTGAFVPDSATAVVMVELTKLLEHDGSEELVIEVNGTAKDGQDIRLPGSDTSKGELLLEKGSTIRSAELGILLASGLQLVNVCKKPKVAVMSTGNEVCEAIRPRLPIGHIRDTNRPQLLALCEQSGADVIDMGIVEDDEESLVQAISTALSISSVLISSGGVSMGEKDLLKSVLSEKFGFKIHFGRVFMKPGLPTTFATGEFLGQKKLVFALPGNPASSWVCAQLFAVPSIRKLRGEHRIWHTRMSAKLSDTVKLDSRPEFRRGFIERKEGEILPIVTTTGNQISSRLVSLRGAQLLLELPGKSEMSEIPAGSIVQALVIDRL